MGQSLVKNYIHIVFSTKNRVHMIKPPHEKELHAYLGAICNELECHVLIVGGYTNHVHILCMLSRKIALMTLLQKLKANSSRWMKTRDESLENFFWQDGYGTFSVNPYDVDVVTKYIMNQHEHHAKKSFKNEYRGLLKKNKIDFDEEHLWD